MEAPTKSSNPPAARRKPWEIPTEIANDPILLSAVQRFLPGNYNFEVPKTVWRIRQIRSRRTALQMPDGLQVFAPALVNILQECAYRVPLAEESDEEVAALRDAFSAIFLGTVTYGACCIDDMKAKEAGCDLLVHYGHSCLVPLDTMSILYVFVDIRFDTQHMIETLKFNFPSTSRLLLVATVQFVTTLQAVKVELQKHFASVIVPQSKPLSPGEILGCTAPKVSREDADLIVYVGDGRFHLESIMIGNPEIDAYRYDPYSKTLTLERYDHQRMRQMRHEAIQKCAGAKVWGLIMSTLGRQGAPQVVEKFARRLRELKLDYVIVALDEIAPFKLKPVENHSDPSGNSHALVGVDTWIQVGCPRLSMDWGSHFTKPLLNPFEAAVALGLTSPSVSVDSVATKDYPVDFYAYASDGPWTPNHEENRPKRSGRPEAVTGPQTAGDKADSCSTCGSDATSAACIS